MLTKNLLYVSSRSLALLKKEDCGTVLLSMSFWSSGGDSHTKGDITTSWVSTMGKVCIERPEESQGTHPLWFLKLATILLSQTSHRVNKLRLFPETEKNRGSGRIFTHACC